VSGEAKGPIKIDLALQRELVVDALARFTTMSMVQSRSRALPHWGSQGQGAILREDEALCQPQPLPEHEFLTNAFASW
jgi:hypothetical protein